MHNLFIEGLKEGNREKLLQVPKSDLHNHSTKGCRRVWLEKRLNRCFPAPPEKFSGLIGMREWFKTTIKPFCNNTEGMVMRWEGAFAEAKRNNIQRLSMNFGAPEIDEMGGMEAFKTVIQGFHRAYCPDTVFEPEITYVSCCDAAEEAEKMDAYLSSGFFKSEYFL